MGMTHAEKRERRRKVAEFAVEHGAGEAAQKYKVSIGTVQHAARENGVRISQRRDSCRGSLKSFRMLRLMLDGKSMADIAEEFCVSRQRVHQVKKDAIEAGFELE
jgi:transposase